MVEISSKPGSQRPESHLLEELQFLDSGSSHWRLVTRSSAWRPPTDVYETEDVVVVRVEIGGMREDGFSIELDGRFLSIRGVRSDVPERRAYYQMEIRFGEFNIDVELPSPIVASEVDAVYKNGLLHVVLPKAKARQIRIED